MLYMNTYDIEEACKRYANHPVLSIATEQLRELECWTNNHSDGWAYWPKPVRAAEKLMTLIGTTRDYLDNPEREDVTEEAYKVALRPIKTFRTRQDASFRIFTP